jgi:hypothetical protein
MTENLKPTSKVIQIATSAVENTEGKQTHMITTALCEDGSIWERRLGYNDWYCILEASTPVAPTIPIPGSLYKYNEEIIEVKENFIRFGNIVMAGICRADGSWEEYSLDRFVKTFKPLEAND